MFWSYASLGFTNPLDVEVTEDLSLVDLVRETMWTIALVPLIQIERVVLEYPALR
jgi:hypothetical protein